MDGKAVQPTLMIGMVVAMDDCSRTAGMGFVAPGDRIALLGALCGPSGGHLGGSEYLKAVHGKTAGKPPPLDLAAEKAVQETVRALVRASLVRSAHDCSEGGVAVALSEMTFPRELGCTVDLPAAPGRADAILFGEDASRILVAYPAANAARVAQAARDKGVPFAEIGEVTGNSLVLSWGRKPLLEVRVAELKEPWTGAVPRIVGEGIHHAALEGH